MLVIPQADPILQDILDHTLGLILDPTTGDQTQDLTNDHQRTDQTTITLRSTITTTMRSTIPTRNTTPTTPITQQTVINSRNNHNSLTNHNNSPHTNHKRTNHNNHMPKDQTHLVVVAAHMEVATTQALPVCTPIPAKSKPTYQHNPATHHPLQRWPQYRQQQLQ